VKRHSLSASADVAASIKEVHINDGDRNKAAGLFRKSSSASKSHRRVVNRDSDSDEECIGPPVSARDTGQPRPSTHPDGDSDDDADEIGPPAPTAVTLQNIEQGSSEQHDDDEDDEIGPPLPDAAASHSERDDDDSQEERATDDDDDDDDDDDGNDEVAVSAYVCYCI